LDSVRKEKKERDWLQKGTFFIQDFVNTAKTCTPFTPMKIPFLPKPGERRKNR
jgi:hypothetical protein